MNAPSIDIKDMLESESGIDLTFAENLFIGKEPSSPENCVTIFDTINQPQELGLNYNNYEYKSVQIRVRNTNYQTGYNLIQSIKEALHGLAHETWNATLYTVIRCSSGPAFLDWDDNDNARFIINFELQRR